MIHVKLQSIIRIGHCSKTVYRAHESSVGLVCMNDDDDDDDAVQARRNLDAHWAQKPSGACRDSLAERGPTSAEDRRGEDAHKAVFRETLK